MAVAHVTIKGRGMSLVWAAPWDHFDVQRLCRTGSSLVSYSTQESLSLPPPLCTVGELAEET